MRAMGKLEGGVALKAMGRVPEARPYLERGLQAALRLPGIRPDGSRHPMKRILVDNFLIELASAATRILYISLQM